MGRFYDHIPEKLGWVKVVQYALTGQTPVPPAEVRPSPNAGSACVVERHDCEAFNDRRTPSDFYLAMISFGGRMEASR